MCTRRGAAAKHHMLRAYADEAGMQQALMALYPPPLDEDEDDNDNDHPLPPGPADLMDLMDVGGPGAAGHA
jgi:hypothetical protein